MNKTKKLWMLGIVPTSIIPFTLISCGTTTSTSNENFQAENLTISAKGEIMGFTDPNYNYPETLEIKDKYNGVTIKSVADNAFKDKPNLTSLTLPSTLVSIGSQAFANTKLCFVTVPNSVTKIGDNAFMNNSLWYNPNLKLPTKFNNDTERTRIGIRLRKDTGTPPVKMTKEEIDKVIYGDGPKTAQKFKEFFELPQEIQDNFDLVKKIVVETINLGQLTIDKTLASSTMFQSLVSEPEIPINLVFDSIVEKTKNKIPKGYELVCSGQIKLNSLRSYEILVKEISNNIGQLWDYDLPNIIPRTISKNNLTLEDKNWINNPDNLIDQNNPVLYDKFFRRAIDIYIQNSYNVFSGKNGWVYRAVQLNKIGLSPVSHGELGYYFTNNGKILSSYTDVSGWENIMKLQREIYILKLDKKPTVEKEKELELLVSKKRDNYIKAEVTIDTKIPVIINVKETFDTSQTIEAYNAKPIATKITETFDLSTQSLHWPSIMKNIVATKTETGWSFEITWELMRKKQYNFEDTVYDWTDNLVSMFLYDFPTTVVKPIK